MLFIENLCERVLIDYRGIQRRLSDGRFCVSGDKTRAVRAAQNYADYAEGRDSASREGLLIIHVPLTNSRDEPRNSWRSELNESSCIFLPHDYFTTFISARDTIEALINLQRSNSYVHFIPGTNSLPTDIRNSYCICPRPNDPSGKLNSFCRTGISTPATNRSVCLSYKQLDTHHTVRFYT